MPRTTKEYRAFDRLMSQLLTVSKADLDARVKAHKERSAANPRKRGPKPKATAASRVPADER